MTKQELYDMKLHAFKDISKDITILRVIGGWLYLCANGEISTVFVPEQSMESSMINPDDKPPEAYRFVE